MTTTKFLALLCEQLLIKLPSNYAGFCIRGLRSVRIVILEMKRVTESDRNGTVGGGACTEPLPLKH